MKKCAQCQSEFLGARKEQRYCSKSCASVRKGNMRKGCKDGPHKNWTYAKRVNRDGYVVMYGGNHPYAEGRLMIAEHIMKMELRLGRRLRKGECVHHKDENKRNNADTNLELQQHAQHSRMHSLRSVAKRKRSNSGRFA